MFRLSLTGRRAEIPGLVARWEDDFRMHRVPVKEFMKTETLQESPRRLSGEAQAGQRNPAAAYELALGRRARTSPATRCPYYVTGERALRRR